MELKNNQLRFLKDFINFFEKKLIFRFNFYLYDNE